MEDAIRACTEETRDFVWCARQVRNFFFAKLQHKKKTSQRDQII
jgi:hypothetical protein